MIQLGQTLHGYQDGHSLLASSQRLPYAAESTLLVLSDLSGQSFVSGFDAYLTGYPLAEANVFALAKTWYAPEMERPGCVWTHTLLIKFGDLARFSELSILSDLFERPKRSRISWAKYEQPLKVDENGSASRRIFRSSQETKIATICDALYSTDTASVIVPSVDADSFEALFLALWGQQWPRLRRRFTFCTGAIESREIAGRNFDLQCIPANFVGIGNVPGSQSIVINGKPELGRLPSDVLDTLLADLEQPNQRLRAFLQNYGADAPQLRTAFTSLISAWLLTKSGITDEEAFRTIVAEVSELFPEKESGAVLKSDLLEADSIGDSEIALTFDERVIAILELARGAEAVSLAFDLREHLSAKVQSAPLEVLALLEKCIRLRTLGSAAQERAFAIAQSIPWEVLESNASPHLLLVLLGTNPELLSRPGVWVRMAGRTHEIVDMFSSKAATEEDWIQLVRATLRNDIPQAASMIFSRGPSNLVPLVLQELEEYPVFSPAMNTWYVEIERRQPAAVSWLRAAKSLSLSNQLGLSLVLDPSYLHTEGIVPSLFEGVAEDWNTRRLAFLLVLTSGVDTESSAQTFAIAFRKLHRLVVGQDIDFFAWEILRNVLPEPSMWSNWDTAERLRRFYADRFSANRWPCNPFWSGLEGVEVVHEVFDYIVSEKRLRSFGRELIRNADHCHLLEWQRAMLSSLPGEKAFRNS
jgi:hypothetical protein